MTRQAVLVERRGPALWVTFNRPEAMNALNAEVYAGLIAAMADADADEAVRAVVLLGEGGRAFSAGADLKEIARFDASGTDPDGEPGTGMGGTQAFEALRALPKPLVAAIDGHCLAGGMEIAILCDIRLATEKSTFGLPEVRLGLLPDPGLVELGHLMPLGEALRIQLTGRPMSAARAYEVGFIQELVPDRTKLLSAAEQIVFDIGLGVPSATRAFKRVAKGAYDLPLTERKQCRDELWEEIRRSDNRIEGPRAFAEKRAPEWKNG
jgi:enoyl-CoA hydratase/carnithine racemase